MSGQVRIVDGIPIRAMTNAERTAKPTVGLWAGSGNSFFDNSREVRAVDPSPAEAELIANPRTKVAYCFGKAEETYQSDSPTKRLSRGRRPRARKLVVSQLSKAAMKRRTKENPYGLTDKQAKAAGIKLPRKRRAKKK